MCNRKMFAWVLTAVVAPSLAGCADPDRGGVPTAPSAMGGGLAAIVENAPFKGHDSGTFEALQTGCSEGLAPLRTYTTGTATLIGAYTFETHECFDTNALTFSGSFTITAANGDTLAGTLVGHGTGFLDEVTVTYAFTATIAGGTGRFDGATGTFSGTGQGNLATFAESRTFVGTISRVPPGHSS